MSELNLLQEAQRILELYSVALAKCVVREKLFIEKLHKISLDEYRKSFRSYFKNIDDFKKFREFYEGIYQTLLVGDLIGEVSFNKFKEIKNIDDEYIANLLERFCNIIDENENKQSSNVTHLYVYDKKQREIKRNLENNTWRD